MRTRTITVARALLLAHLSLALMATGCSFSAFNDLADQAPAVKLEQGGEVSSSAFGVHLVGFARPAADNGAFLAITGNNAPAYAFATFGQDGGVNLGNTEKDDIERVFDDPSRIDAMIAAPSGGPVAKFQGPFVYVGSTSGTDTTVRVINVPTASKVTVLDAPTAPVAVDGFGAGLARADLGSDTTAANTDLDLAVGCRGAIALLRPTVTSNAPDWPNMDTGGSVVVQDSGWPNDEFSVLAAGDIDPSGAGDEVVAAIPGRGIVVVLHHLQDCFQSPGTVCTSYITLDTKGATRPGHSLLVADIDGSGGEDVLVGDPDGNQVLVYSIDAKYFDGSTQDGPGPDRTLTPSDARRFGTSLAWGKITGQGQPLLAVGAIGTEVDGAESAGAIYVLDSSYKEVARATLASPEADQLLGEQLAIMPFRVSGQSSPLEVLAAAGDDAVYVFFSNLTSDHDDTRNR